MFHTKRLLPILLFFILSSCSPGVGSESKAPIPTARPKPDFIIDTLPSASQVLAISIFNAGDGRLGSGFGSFGESLKNIEGYNSTVCLSVNSGSLAQKGDDFTDQSKFEQGITLEVDDLSPIHLFSMAANLELINVGDIDGNIFIRGIGPKIICGIVDIGVGIHKVYFQYRQTSGDILEYTWHFELTRG